MARTPTGEELNPTPAAQVYGNKADANLLQNVNIGGGAASKIPSPRGRSQGKDGARDRPFGSSTTTRTASSAAPSCKGLKEMGLSPLSLTAAMVAIFADPALRPRTAQAYLVRGAHSLVIPLGEDAVMPHATKAKTRSAFAVVGPQEGLECHAGAGNCCPPIRSVPAIPWCVNAKLPC